MDEQSNQPGLPTNTEDLIRRIESAWATLQASIADLSDAQLNVPDEGGWSIKDNLAHLTAWENYMVATHLHGQPAHKVMGVDQSVIDAGENAINAAIQQRSRSRSTAEVMAEAQRTHAAALQTLRQMPFADLMKPHYADDPEQRPVINWVIGNTYEHYEEHSAYIQKQMRRLTS